MIDFKCSDVLVTELGMAPGSPRMTQPVLALGPQSPKSFSKLVGCKFSVDSTGLCDYSEGLERLDQQATKDWYPTASRSHHSPFVSRGSTSTFPGISHTSRPAQYCQGPPQRWIAVVTSKECHAFDQARFASSSSRNVPWSTRGCESFAPGGFLM